MHSLAKTSAAAAPIMPKKYGAELTSAFAAPTWSKRESMAVRTVQGRLEQGRLGAPANRLLSRTTRGSDLARGRSKHGLSQR